MMLENMSSNQRLLLAVALSFVFFVGYTAIFPPQQPAGAEHNVTQQAAQGIALKEERSTAAGVQTQAKPAEAVNVGHSVPTEEKVAIESQNTLVDVASKHFSMKIDTLGRISSVLLLDEKYNDKEGNPTQMVPENGAIPLYIRFADETLDKAAIATAYKTDVKTVALKEGRPATVTLTQSLSGLTIEKKLTLYSDGHYDISVNLSEDKRYFVYLGQHPKHDGQMRMAVHGSMIYAGDNLTTIFEDGDVEARSSFSGVHLASSFDQYFASIFYGLKSDTNVIVERDRDSNPIVYVEGHGNMAFNGYVGPKDYKQLESINPILVNAIEYGWFTFASAPLFKVLMWLEGIFGNWGWAIIALTALIRMVLYPLTYKGMVSMQKMKEIAPKIKELQAKHKGDPQRMNAAVMDMYKKHGANPLGGCLPLLLQIPVFFAIYRVLLNAVELQGASWILWVTDLSRMDQYYVLPLLMGASMYYQQKMTPSNFTDPMQEKIFKFLPVIFTFFFITFPSGLVLYWFVNNLFSIAQQWMVNRRFAAMKEERHEQHLAEKHHAKEKDHDKD